MGSSKLLINELPLQLLPTLAVKIGLNEAIFLQQLHFWLTINSKDPSKKATHLLHERWWAYNTYDYWQRNNFPFWSISTIKRIVKSLESDWAKKSSAERIKKLGIERTQKCQDNELKLVLSMANPNNFQDKTKWYSIDYEVLNALCSPSGQSDLIEFFPSGQSDRETGQSDRETLKPLRSPSGQSDTMEFPSGQSDPLNLTLSDFHSVNLTRSYITEIRSGSDPEIRSGSDQIQIKKERKSASAQEQNFISKTSEDESKSQDGLRMGNAQDAHEPLADLSPVKSESVKPESKPWGEQDSPARQPARRGYPSSAQRANARFEGTSNQASQSEHSYPWRTGSGLNNFDRGFLEYWVNDYTPRLSERKNKAYLISDAKLWLVRAANDPVRHEQALILYEEYIDSKKELSAVSEPARPETHDEKMRRVYAKRAAPFSYPDNLPKTESECLGMAMAITVGASNWRHSDLSKYTPLPWKWEGGRAAINMSLPDYETVPPVGASEEFKTGISYHMESRGQAARFAKYLASAVEQDKEGNPMAVDQLIMNMLGHAIVPIKLDKPGLPKEQWPWQNPYMKQLWAKYISLLSASCKVEGSEASQSSYAFDLVKRFF